MRRTLYGDDMPSLRLGSKKKELLVNKSSFFFGTPDAIRTHDLQSRSLTLYPAELQAHIAFGCGGYYTLFFSLCKELFV